MCLLRQEDFLRITYLLKVYVQNCPKVVNIIKEMLLFSQILSRKKGKMYDTCDRERIFRTSFFAFVHIHCMNSITSKNILCMWALEIFLLHKYLKLHSTYFSYLSVGIQKMIIFATEKMQVKWS